MPQYTYIYEGYAKEPYAYKLIEESINIFL